MHAAKKRLARICRSFFSEHGFAGSEAHKPQRPWKFEGSTVELFFHVVLRLNGALIVYLKYHGHIKASVTFIAFSRVQSNHTLTRCVFLVPTLFYKTHKNIIIIL